MVTTQGTNTRIDEKGVLYFDMDANKGQSGSSIWDDNGVIVAVLVRGSFDANELNEGTVLTVRLCGTILMRIALTRMV